MASSFCTVKVVWDLYAPIHAHLIQASEDLSRPSSVRVTFKSMATRMASESFVLSLGAMHDSLEELASLSKDLQERNIMLPRAHTLSMIDYPGMHYREAKSAIEGGKDVPVPVNKFKGVVVTNNRKSDVQIQYGQFMRSLVKKD